PLVMARFRHSRFWKRYFPNYLSRKAHAADRSKVLALTITAVWSRSLGQGRAWQSGWRPTTFRCRVNGLSALLRPAKGSSFIPSTRPLWRSLTVKQHVG